MRFSFLTETRRRQQNLQVRVHYRTWGMTIADIPSKIAANIFGRREQGVTVVVIPPAVNWRHEDQLLFAGNRLEKEGDRQFWPGEAGEDTGGSHEDHADAREWVSLFFHEAVIRQVTAPGDTRKRLCPRRGQTQETELCGY